MQVVFFIKFLNFKRACLKITCLSSFDFFLFFILLTKAITAIYIRDVHTGRELIIQPACHHLVPQGLVHKPIPTTKPAYHHLVPQGLGHKPTPTNKDLYQLHLTKLKLDIC